MRGFSDYVEFSRPEGKKVRVVFELEQLEVLFYFCEFQHDQNAEWKSLSRNDDGYFEYSIVDENGKSHQERVLYPTFDEILSAQDEINKKYNILSV
jgi:hypothetical protein